MWNQSSSVSLLAVGSSVLSNCCLTGCQLCCWDKAATSFQGIDHHHHHHHHQPALPQAKWPAAWSESPWLCPGQTLTNSHGGEPTSAFSQEQRLQQSLCASSVPNCLGRCTSHLLRSTFSSTEGGTSGGQSLKCWKCFRDVGHHTGLDLPKTHLES